MCKLFNAIMLTLFAISMVAMTGCSIKESSTQRKQELTNFAINDMIFMKDPRTGLCFAIVENQTGGPTCVPCDSISPELLFTAEIKFK